MMTSTFPPHPTGMQPGMPHGHPGMPMNAGQPMGQGMQMHPGVSGPGGPHMAQATAMMGMQPNAGNMPGAMGGQGPGGGMGMPGQSMGGPGPNAMAVSHLTPQQGMLAQQQQLQQASKCSEFQLYPCIAECGRVCSDHAGGRTTARSDIAPALRFPMQQRLSERKAWVGL